MGLTYLPIHEWLKLMVFMYVYITIPVPWNVFGINNFDTFGSLGCARWWASRLLVPKIRVELVRRGSGAATSIQSEHPGSPTRRFTRPWPPILVTEKWNSPYFREIQVGKTFFHLARMDSMDDHFPNPKWFLAHVFQELWGWWVGPTNQWVFRKCSKFQTMSMLCPYGL